MKVAGIVDLIDTQETRFYCHLQITIGDPGCTQIMRLTIKSDTWVKEWGRAKTYHCTLIKAVCKLITCNKSQYNSNFKETA